MKNKSPQEKRLNEMAEKIPRDKQIAEKIDEFIEIISELPLREDITDAFIKSLVSITDMLEKSSFYLGASAMLEVLKQLPIGDKARR